MNSCPATLNGRLRCPDQRQRTNDVGPGTAILSASKSGGLGRLAACLLVAGACWLPVEAPAQPDKVASPCGVVQRDTEGGPYDYRSKHPKLATVERFHFTTKVEQLLSGSSGAYPINDLEFVFRHFPNHHRALVSLVRLAEREKTPQPRGATYSVACHFERALQFAPDDAVTRMLYAQYLLKSGQADAGVRHLEVVKKDRPDDPISQYNVGLIYFEAGRYPEAREQAHLAQQLGFPRLDLKERLVAKGQWQEPADTTPK